MKIKATEIKKGFVLLYEDDLWVVSKGTEHTKPGKGVAYIKVELKNFKTNIKKNVRFVSDEKVEKIFVEEEQINCLYYTDEHLVLMNLESGEERLVDKDILDGHIELLSDNVEVTLEICQDIPIRVRLPDQVVVEIADTPSVAKGATAAPSYKVALLTNGLKIDVPPYCSIGEKLLIKTDDLSFVSRAKL